MQNKQKPNRTRFKKTFTYNKRKIKEIIKKEKVKKKGLSANDINSILSNTPNFLGCFAQDELPCLSASLPVFMIVNFDNSFSSGSQWIALRIDKRRLEIFDPLGFNSLRWPSTPHLLLDFLHKYSLNRRIFTTKEIQPYSSTLCGFYCVFFILYRSVQPFSACTKYFSKNLQINDKLLLNFFNKL